MELETRDALVHTHQTETIFESSYLIVDCLIFNSYLVLLGLLKLYYEILS